MTSQTSDYLYYYNGTTDILLLDMQDISGGVIIPNSNYIDANQTVQLTEIVTFQRVGEGGFQFDASDGISYIAPWANTDFDTTKQLQYDQSTDTWTFNSNTDIDGNAAISGNLQVDGTLSGTTITSILSRLDALENP